MFIRSAWGWLYVIRIWPAKTETERIVARYFAPRDGIGIANDGGCRGRLAIEHYMMLMPEWTREEGDFQ